MSALRILAVTPRFGASSGGVERHVLEVGRRLVAGGDVVTVLTADATGELPREERLAGMEIRRVRAWPRDRDWQIAPGIVPALTQMASDVVHVQSYHTGVAPAALAAAIALGRPTVLTFHSGGHSSGLRRGLRGVQLLALRPWIRAADALVAVSSFEADELARRLRLARSRFTVIPNGADLGERDADEAEVPRTPGLVLSVGRLEAYKGHDRAIRALPWLQRRVPGARLVVLGEGPDEARLRGIAAEEGVAGAVAFERIDAADRAAMRRRLRSASAVVLLSAYESQGIAAFEALATETPVVVTAATAYAELAADGRAIGTSSAASSEEVAAAIEDALRGGARAAGRLPTWDSAALALSRLYRSVVAS